MSTESSYEKGYQQGYNHGYSTAMQRASRFLSEKFSKILERESRKEDAYITRHEVSLDDKG